jgi:EAL domain-containing protein (putative c-di-GMP-specific phosphodiesterase class I)/GGDEF domain-containing protein
MNTTETLSTILSNECIRSVFQPIVSLKDGSILGYEALSRITAPACEIDIEELFELAQHENKLWELEKLCRKKALDAAASKPEGAAIFLNVDANIIHDREFQAGFTTERLSECGIPARSIIFEITEKTAIADMDVFVSSVKHYKNQSFQIAIDDFGSGYSGLNYVCSISPDYLKLDINLIRDIDTNAVKKSAVASTADFCKQAGIKVIAEGIETEAELKTLIRLGIPYGQGYYLARPTPDFVMLTEEQTQEIKAAFHKTELNYTPQFFGRISDLGSRQEVAKRSDSALSIFEKMKHDSALSEFFVVDENECVCGTLTRRCIFEKFSGEFGYYLSKRTVVNAILQPDFLSVDEQLSINQVAEMAMQRSPDRVYDAIAVTRDGKYLCTVTVRDLLLASIQVQVKCATDANPLTGLPGNHQIQQVITGTFSKKTPWSIIYLDLDNFKAYNDAYGFTNGDLMIKAVAQALEQCCTEAEFFGHIGGDDFVIVADTHDVLPLCKNICAVFGRSIEPLYSPSDWQQGYIVSKNRNGFTENFGIVSLSIAVVSNKNSQPDSMESLSKLIAGTKERAKQQTGNAIIME